MQMSTPAFNPSHTPSIYYALAYFGASCVLLRINKMRLSKRMTAAVSILYMVCLAGFMYATDGVDDLFYVITMLLVFSSIFLFVYATMDVPWKKALYTAVFAFILGEFASSFEWQVFYIGVSYFGFPFKDWFSILFLLLFYGVLFSLVYLILRGYRDRNIALEISSRELVISLSLGFTFFFFSNLSLAFPDAPFSSHLDNDIFAIHTLADLCGVGILFALHIQLCESSAIMEKEYLHKLLHMQKENYRISEESVALVNQKYHDLKHQIQLLRSEISSDEKLRYLDEMEQEIRSYEAQNKTGNKTLDTLLTAKSLKCQDLGITLTCVADGAELDFMKPTDLSVLFGNALDNAIESVEKISDPDKRLIHVSVARQKAFLRIRVENCYEGEINFVGGLPSTAKDARYHGYGMKSIQSIVEKYNGSMTVKAEDGWFELRVLFPISS
jgi:signal transduction histidine kinase